MTKFEVDYNCRNCGRPRGFHDVDLECKATLPKNPSGDKLAALREALDSGKQWQRQWDVEHAQAAPDDCPCELCKALGRHADKRLSAALAASPAMGAEVAPELSEKEELEWTIFCDKQAASCFDTLQADGMLTDREYFTGYMSGTIEDSFRLWRMKSSAEAKSPHKGEGGVDDNHVCKVPPLAGATEPAGEQLRELHAKIQSWANNCAVYEAQSENSPTTRLYHRGGKEAFQRVVDEFLPALAASSALPATPTTDAFSPEFRKAICDLLEEYDTAQGKDRDWLKAIVSQMTIKDAEIAQLRAAATPTKGEILEEAARAVEAATVQELGEGAIRIKLAKKIRALGQPKSGA